MRPAHIDQNQVGPGSQRDNAQLALHADRARSADGRHAQRLVCRQHARIAGSDFLQQRGRAHLVQHIEVVVRAGAVGSDADRQAAPDHPRDRSDPAGKLHVALRIICDRHPVAKQDVHILLGQVHAVHGQRRIIENAQIAQILGRGLVVTLPDRLGFGTRLAQMDMNAQAVSFT